MSRRRRTTDPNALIVMTPMIDVMTVLLAVFLVSAPMLTAGIDMDLPHAGKSAMTGGDHALQLSVSNTGQYFLLEGQLARDEIVKRAAAMRGENPKLSITLNGDRSADYGAVMSMMGALKDAGFQKVSLRTKLDN